MVGVSTLRKLTSATNQSLSGGGGGVVVNDIPLAHTTEPSRWLLRTSEGFSVSSKETFTWKMEGLRYGHTCLSLGNHSQNRGRAEGARFFSI